MKQTPVTCHNYYVVMRDMTEKDTQSGLSRFVALIQRLWRTVVSWFSPAPSAAQESSLDEASSVPVHETSSTHIPSDLEEKTEDTPFPHTPPPYIDRGKPVPNEYGRDVLRILPRDPSWAFVYWELTPYRLEKLQARYPSLSSCTWHLSVSDKTDNTHMLVPIFLRAYNWYITVQPRHLYMVELGFLDGDKFITVLTAPSIRMPSDAISSRTDEEWMVLRRDIMKMIRLRSEADLLGPGHPHASAHRYEEMTEEQRDMLLRQADAARRKAPHSGMTSPTGLIS